MIADVWSKFLLIAKEEAGSRVVETWFKAVSLQRWDAVAQAVYLETPNAFIRDWIKRNYLELLTTHLKRLFNVDHLSVYFCDSASKLTLVPEVTQSQNAVSKIVQKGQRLRDSYSFENFVVGPNNQLATAAAQAVCAQPGLAYNPLFIYGQSGLGKTHLLHAIAHDIRKQHPQLTVLYQSADRFVHEFIHAIRLGKANIFIQKYKTVQVLLIDDIQVICGKEQTQEVFFHIFNALHDARKQIVFTSDTFPQDMQGIADRLRYRLSWGLVVDMHVPTLETRVAILKKKAQSYQHRLTDEVAHFISESATTNVRELEGALVRIMAYATLTNQGISMDLAQKIIQQTHPKEPDTFTQDVDYEKILRVFKKYYSYSLSQLQSKNRSKELSLARQVAMYLIKQSTTKSLRDIGMYLGGRDHSTVVHAIEKIDEQRTKDVSFDSKIKEMMNLITARSSKD